MATTAICSRAFDSAIPRLDLVFGRSKHALELRHQLECVTNANLPVLIEGESGTGKEILARLVHSSSQWQSGLFVKVACPAIPAALFESELFGYEKGSFTGAFGSKPGKVELAHRGTLFLDEIGELEIGLQSKLLQVLQESQFSRIGGTEDKRIETRLVCATNRNLEEEVSAGRFRKDLFYRINVVNLRLAPLRHRVEDIPDLIAHFIEKYNDKFNQRAKPLSLQLLLRLQRYSWPGNIRELENLIKRYVVFGTESVFDSAVDEASHLENKFVPLNIETEMTIGSEMSLKGITKQVVRDIERQLIFKCLRSHNWNCKLTARALKISYRALLYKIQEAGLDSGI